jgi:hypothetical protein
MMYCSHTSHVTPRAEVLIEDAGSNGDGEDAGLLISADQKGVFPSVTVERLSEGFFVVSDNAGSMSQSSGKIESGGGGGDGGSGGGGGGGGVGGRGRQLSSPPVPPDSLWDSSSPVISDDDELMDLDDGNKAVEENADLPMISVGSDEEQDILLK